MAAEITRLQTELTSAKNEKDSLTKSYEKLQQKAGHQVWTPLLIVTTIGNISMLKLSKPDKVHVN